MSTIRNEILEQGQEVLMYGSVNWKGNIGGIATLVNQIGNSEFGAVKWEITAKDVIAPIPPSVKTWWFGIPKG